MYRAIFVFLALLSLGVSGSVTGNVVEIHINTHSRSPDARIVGGDLANDSEAHFIVKLFVKYPDSTIHQCAGTLITNQHILTTAFCVNGLKSAKKMKVVMGVHDLEHVGKPRIDMVPLQYIVHAKFNETSMENDIAIIKLPSYVKTASQPTISKVQIPESEGSPGEYVGKTGRVYGWGVVVDGPSQTTVNNLRYADTTIIPNQECPYYDIVESNICTSPWSKEWKTHMVGICDADIGGPLIVDDIQIGIISARGERCEGGLPSVYTRIDKFLVWIDDTIEMLGY